ncbi:MAG: MFS transporter [Proteobacteria bacterium]|nr:MFS transporter [Pseudomonadota bacterium]
MNEPIGTTDHLKPSQSLFSSAAYGVLEVGVSGVESFLRLYLLIFYTDRVGIDPKWAGAAVAIGVLWDAVMDPVVGVLCDRTESRYGKRIPWIVISAPLFAASVVFAFYIPSGLSGSQKILWLLMSNIAVNTTMAALSIPHLALGSDVTRGAEARTKLYAWRMLMSVIGLFVGVAVPAVVRSKVPDLGQADFVSAQVLGVLTIALSAVTIAVFAPKARRAARTSVMIAQQLSPLKAALVAPSGGNIVSFLKSKAFVLLMIGYAVATFGQGLNSSLALYFYKYVLLFSEKQLQLTLVVFMGFLIISLPIWVIASKRYAKHQLLSLGVLSLGLMTTIAYPLLPAGRLDLAMIVGSLGGLSLGCIALFESHLTDLMAEWGLTDLHNGKVFGIWKFLAKSARAAAIGVSGTMLATIGYTSQSSPNASTVAKISLLFGPGVGFCFMVGAVVLWFASVRKVRDRDLPLKATT